MAVVTGSWVADALILLATLLFLFYLYFNSTANYFKDRGIPYLRPTPFVGQLEIFTKPQIDLAQFLYNSFPDKRFFGYFQAKVPTLLVKDPDLVHRIMIKDFAYFHDRGFPFVESDMLAHNLFNMKGQPWRILRQKLIPTFSTGKLKQMFDQLNKCGDILMEDVEKVSQSGEAIEARMFIFNFTVEVIGSTAFGLDFGKDSPQGKEFISKIKDIFSLTFRQMAIFFFMLVAPWVINMLKIAPFKQDAADYFLNLTKATKKYRKQNNVKRNDYFQLLLTLQEAEETGKSTSPAVAADISEEDAIINQMEFAPQSTHDETVGKLFTDERVTAQTFVFLTAGSESVSGTLSFVLYHIAKDATVQNRLVDDVDQALAKHNSWSYQAVKDMTYLDLVIQEVQRMYPIVPITMRECTIPYAIPDSDIVLEKGAVVAIPVGALQMDPKYYSSPELFDPDRFADNNHKPSSTFMPFGDGPRICIAMRFAILEMKVCVAKIMAKYSVEVNSKTKEPFLYDKKSFFTRPVGGIWINFKKRSQKST